MKKETYERRLEEVTEACLLHARQSNFYIFRLLQKERRKLLKVIQRRKSDARYENLWDELTDIPMDETASGELILAVEWYVFPLGTTRTHIWHWFDEVHSKGVGWLMYDYRGGKNYE